MVVARGWVEVEVPAAVQELPCELCANCGGTEDLILGPTMTFGGLRGHGFAGVARKVKFRAGACRTCASTMGRPHPWFGDHFALSLAGLLALLLAGWSAMFVLGFTDRIGEVAVGAAVVAVGAPFLWFRRRPRPPRTCHYQPIRLVALVHDKRGAEPRLRLAFSNPIYAAAVGSAVGASSIPSARVVRG